MYSLYRFMGVNLPMLAATMSTGTDAAISRRVALPGGGMFDGWGSGRAGNAPQNVTLSAEIHGTTQSAVMSTFEALRALQGQHGLLERRRMSDGAVHNRFARLIEVPSELNTETVLYQPLSFTWELTGRYWRGATIVDVTYSGETTPDPFTFTLTNTGNEVATEVRLTQSYAGAVGFTTAFRNLTTDTDVAWFESGLTLGDTLVIDGTNHSVKRNGVGAYHGLYTLRNDWIRLAPGVNNIQVPLLAVSGGNSLRVEFYPAWK